MSTRRVVVLWCDCCYRTLGPLDELPDYFDGVRRAVDKARAEGWHVARSSHVCAECVEALRALARS